MTLFQKKCAFKVCHETRRCVWGMRSEVWDRLGFFSVTEMEKGSRVWGESEFCGACHCHVPGGNVLPRVA